MNNFCCTQCCCCPASFSTPFNQPQFQVYPWNYFQLYQQPNFGNFMLPQNSSCLINSQIPYEPVKKDQILARSVISDQVKLQQIEIMSRSEEIQKTERPDENKSNKKYPKKNAQTNTVCQFFSFVHYERKSKSIVSKVFKNDKNKVEVFYAYMKTLKSYKTKYVNSSYLINLVFLPQNSQQYKLVTRSQYRIKIVSPQQLRKAMRCLALYFLRSQARLSIIQNKKIAKDTIDSHFGKARQLYQLLIKESLLVLQR